LKDSSFIILGAGKGERFGFEKIKIKIFEIPIFIYILKKLEGVKFIGEVIIVCPEKLMNYVKKEVRKFSFKFRVSIVKGGNTRCESMERGIRKAKYENVFIHDLVRPFFSTKFLYEMRKKLSKNALVVPFFSPYDTVEYKREVLKREEVKLIHTPQGTKKSLILKALSKTGRRDFPDESSLLREILNIKPFYLKDDFFNFKITFMEDMENLNKFFDVFKIKTGAGFDIHKLSKGKGSLYIGGVNVKRGIRAIGHSDGDALIHSLCDALLGVMGKGDIGDYFPDTDKRWKDVKSEIFLKKIIDIFYKEGFEILNVDITISLDKPKLGKKKDKIRENLARIMKIEKERINIKAKTTEGLFENVIFSYALLTVRGKSPVFVE